MENDSHLENDSPQNDPKRLDPTRPKGPTRNGPRVGLDADLKAGLTERLHLVVSSGDAAAASALLAQGADVNGERGEGGDFTGWTPLDVAAHRGDEGACRLLLDGGAALRLEDHLPLMMAAGEGHEAVCRLLLQRGAEVNAVVGPGFSALMAAVEMGKTPIVRLLLAAGADPNASRDFLPPDSPVGAADKRRGPAPGGGGQGGRELTCLMVAATAGHADVCRLLAGHGAALEARGLFGLTALGLAAHGGRLDACQALLGAGADPNARDAEGDTPLTLAAGEGFTDVCRLLLDGGADAEATNRAGHSALTLARDRQDVDTLALLIGRRPDFPRFDELPGGPQGAGPAFCPRCGSGVTGGAAFCARCGSAVDGAPPPSRAALASPALLGGLSHVDYSRVFAPFEAAGGKWVPTFNLLAFLLGPLWYLLKGMWLKAILLGAASFFLILVTGGLAAFIPWLYYGFFGNWDLYLWERQGKQGW